jgi:AbrB family looped-hinge helix DNA binding protein
MAMLSLGVMLSVKISSRNQIAVPSQARRILGIGPGDRLSVEVTADAMVLRPRPRSSDRLRGIARGAWRGQEPDEYVRGLRDELEREMPK